MSATFITLSQAREEPGQTRVLAHWVEGYLCRPHTELGRPGAVCPWTRQAGLLDTMRLAVSTAVPGDAAALRRTVREADRELGLIPHRTGNAQFRTVLVGFPECAGAAGEAALGRAARPVTLRALVRRRMVGVFGPSDETPGLWNADFRPMRAPFPIVAVRPMVEQDALFARGNRLLSVAYLAGFGRAGWARMRGAAS